jgi:hypothetical protein
MAASYPTIVRRFTPHVDGTEYVMAGHMNDVQDELAAVESTLGPKPHIYTPNSGTPTAYSSVASRLDGIQQTAAAQQAQINSLLDASKNGWALPIASVYASGTSIPPTKRTDHVATDADWYRVRWVRAMVDTNGAYSSGFYVTIPKRGWYIVTSTTTMKNPVQDVDIEHNVWVRVKVSGPSPADYEIGKDDSSAVMNSGGWHRMTTASGVELYEGDRVYLQVRHDYIAQDPNPINRQTLSASARMQLTYVRALPNQIISRAEALLPDELDPTNP